MYFIFLFCQASKNAVSRSEAPLTAAFRTVFWMAKEDLPISKYPSLVSLQKLQGCNNLCQISVGKNATYNSRIAGSEFQECISETIHQNIQTAVRNAKFFAVLLDESTDISISKQMVVYVRIVDADFTPKTFFLEDICIDNPKSDAGVLFGSLMDCLDRNGLDVKKCVGFGSDGASVMTGRHSGVAARVKQKSPHCVSVHCMAHRLNLCSAQASKGVPYMKTFEKTCSELYYYFGGSKSGNRRCELTDIQKVLNDPQLKIKECHEIRWIAFFEAISAINKTWPSLVTYFTRHDDSTAKSLLSKLTDYRFVKVMALMMDILPYVASVSTLLQKRDIDIAAVQPALDNLKEKITSAKKGRSPHQRDLSDDLVQKKDRNGNVKQVKFKGHTLQLGENLSETSKEFSEAKASFCDNLSKNIESRFPKHCTDIGMAFHVFGLRPLSFLPGDDKKEFGQKEIDILVKHFGQDKTIDNVTSKAIVDEDLALHEWSLVKDIVLQQKYPLDSFATLWKIIHLYHSDTLPNLLKLANIALIMPYQTADCERGFSAQNNIKNARRSRLKGKALNCLMTIKIEGGCVENFDFSPAIALWKEKKNRRIDSK